MATAIPGRLIEERPKSVLWDPLVDANPPFWIPRSQIEEMATDVVIVNDWWLGQLKNHEPTKEQLAHRAGCCHVCGFKYEEHPRAPGRRAAKYLMLCDAIAYNVERGMKVALCDLHKPEWKASAELVREQMLNRPG